MRILVVGGSGYVGSLVLPMVAETHELRIYDRQPPPDPAWAFVTGSIDDHQALTEAAQGMDVLLYMAMGSKQFDQIESITSNFDVSVKGLYLALHAAHHAGIGHAVYTSSMSVYAGDLYQRFFADEDLTPENTHFYGLTKRFGEEICRNACREWGMSVNALRLCHPTPDQAWMSETTPDQPTINTAASDVGRAILAALRYRAGFQAFMISGDYRQRIMRMDKARRLLGWQPTQRPFGAPVGD